MVAIMGTLSATDGCDQPALGSMMALLAAGADISTACVCPHRQVQLTCRCNFASLTGPHGIDWLSAIRGSAAGLSTSRA